MRSHFQLISLKSYSPFSAISRFTLVVNPSHSPEVPTPKLKIETPNITITIILHINSHALALDPTSPHASAAAWAVNHKTNQLGSSSTDETRTAATNHPTQPHEQVCSRPNAQRNAQQHNHLRSEVRSNHGVHMRSEVRYGRLARKTIPILAAVRLAALQRLCMYSVLRNACTYIASLSAATRARQPARRKCIVPRPRPSSD